MTQPKTASKFTPGAVRAQEAIRKLLGSAYLYPGHNDFDGTVALIIDRETKAPEMYELLKRIADRDKWWPPHLVEQEARRIKAAIDGEG